MKDFIGFMKDFSRLKKLPIDFYTRELHTVARHLLGKIFIRRIKGALLAGKIVEVEAYDGSVDAAAHSYNGITKRNEVMFKGGGKLYVYFTYGMHFCSNVVTGKPGEGTAVLLRGIEPLKGIEIMALNRFGKKEISRKELINLANGPAKISEAFSIDKSENGISLTGNEIWIAEPTEAELPEIESSIRIGIKKSVDLPWRYYIKNNPFVSSK